LTKISRLAHKDDNHLYYGDNLDILRSNIADESVDLVYLDPPFNSQAKLQCAF
jgi:site-specific DNA-methyltransferase (adenine-specific)